ncbi:MAG TPA: hypothetical protein PKE05_02685 [Microthrixaceae bacterium]|nr:hypothetical protein [Microthrixaceae bacterium]
MFHNGDHRSTRDVFDVTVVERAAGLADDDDSVQLSLLVGTQRPETDIVRSPEHTNPEALLGAENRLRGLIVEGAEIEELLESPSIDDLDPRCIGLQVHALDELDGKTVEDGADGDAQRVGVVSGDVGWAAGGEGCSDGKSDGRGAMASPDADELNGSHGCTPCSDGSGQR